jgi:hypothetical protein
MKKEPNAIILSLSLLFLYAAVKAFSVFLKE